MKNKTLYINFLFAAFLGFYSCNKDVEQFPDPPTAQRSSAKAGVDTISTISNYSLYNAVIVKSGLAPTLRDSSKTFTLFVPGNAAVKQAITMLTMGAIPSNAPDAAFLAFINSASFSQQTAAGIVGYNSVPQKIDYSALTHGFPNLQYVTMINPASDISPLLRLTTFPSKTNGNYVNNIPLMATNIVTGNGYIHETGAVVVPPSRFLWDTINNAPNLTYFKAAIVKADSGTTAPGYITSLLQNIGANFTVFAPSDAAFKTILTGLITQKLVAQGIPPAIAHAQATLLSSTTGVFTNPALSTVLTAQNVKGIVFYHMLGSRAFTNNFPKTQANYPTLLNLAVSAHPGIGLTATFTGPVVSAATVKGAVNATAANLSINPTPGVGTSDQNFLNGVLHKIDQVLLPMAF